MSCCRLGRFWRTLVPNAFSSQFCCTLILVDACLRRSGARNTCNTALVDSRGETGYGMVWYAMVCISTAFLFRVSSVMVWYGMVWYGMVCITVSAVKRGKCILGRHS